MGSYKDSMEEYKEEFGENMGTLGLPIHAHIPTIVSHKIHDLARSKLKDTAQNIFIDPTSKEIAAHAAFLGEYVADAFRRDLHSQHLA